MVERYMLQQKPVPVKRHYKPRKFTYEPRPGRRDLMWACLAEVRRGDAIAALYARMVVKTIAEIDEQIASEFADQMSKAGVDYNRFARPRMTT